MKHILAKVILTICILFIGYAILGTIIKVSILKNKGICTKAVLMPELSSFTHRYTNSYLIYQFIIDGKAYKGNSLENDLKKIGDSVCIL